MNTGLPGGPWTGGQTLNDRLNAARYALAGQGLARVVCKATTEEIIGPKKKHLDYLLQCTHEPNVSIPQMANLLIERTGHSSWVVVFKALITVHHLMCYGNERFTQYLASSNCNFQLSNFLDKNGVKAYDMSTFIRRYARYINEKALSYRQAAFDFCKIKRGKEEGSLRTQPTDRLLKMIPILQNQLDALLDFDASANDLTNGVINAAFMLLFRDLIRLFACYNDGIINLLEKFFDMNRKQCREALDIYKKFLIRMDRVAEFLKTAENVGIDKGEIPDLARAPSSLLEALEAHYASLESNKKAKKNKDKGGSADTSATTSTPAAASTTSTDGPTNGAVSSDVKDADIKKALEEEARLMEQLKEKHKKEEATKPYNPFLISPTAESKAAAPATNASGASGDALADLISPGGTNTAQSGAASAEKGVNDDLLNLSNPFADFLNSLPNVPPAGSVPPPKPAPPAGYPGASDSTGGFLQDAAFDQAFGGSGTNPASSAFDAFGDVLQPQPAAMKANQAPTLTPMVASGGMMNNSHASSNSNSSSTAQQGSGSGSLLKGDLDSSLASLAQNLDINLTKGGFKSQQMRSQQFASPKNSVRTGGPNATVSWPSPSPTPTVFPPQNNMSGAHLSWNQQPAWFK